MITNSSPRDQGLSPSIGTLLQDALAPVLDYARPKAAPPAHSRPSLVEQASTDQASAGSTLHSIFRDRVANSPAALAASDATQSFTLAQLHQRANFFAAQLARAGAKHRTPIALILPPSLDLLAGILAALKLGAFYLPLDPELPRPHIQLCLNDARPTVLTTHTLARTFGLVKAALTDQPGSASEPAGPSVLPQDTAALLYTIGATSIPKGVEFTHAALLHALVALGDEIALTASDIFLAASSVSTPAATFELLLPLVSGAPVIIAPAEHSRDPWHLSRLIESSGCTVFHAPPSVWQALISIGWRPPRPIKALSSGEPLPRKVANQLLGLDLQLWTLYGSAATTSWSLVHRVQPGESPIPLGKPLAGTSAFILDNQQRPLPPNLPGELFLGGPTLAKGYRGQAALTARAFISLPSAQATRLYRTGDRALRREDGTIELCDAIGDTTSPTIPAELTHTHRGWSQTQKTVATLWSEVIAAPITSLDDNFFDLGGHSLLIARLQHRFTSTFGRPVTMAVLFHNPTLRQHAALVESLLESTTAQPSGILALQPSGTRPPLFWFHPTPFVRNLIHGLGDDQPLIASVLTPEDIEQVGPAPSMEAIAARHAASILAVRPEGPFYLGGYCIGGVVAYAVAAHLTAAGHHVELVILLDSQNPVFYRRVDRLSVEFSKIRFYFGRALRKKKSAISLTDRLADRFRALLRSTAAPATEMGAAEQLTDLASGTYRPPAYSGSVLLLQPQERPAKVNYRPGWLTVVQPGLEIADVPGHHDELLAAQNAPAVAAAMAARIQQQEARRTRQVEMTA